MNQKDGKSEKESLCLCGHQLFGYTVGGGVLRKEVEAHKHMLRQPPGWAIQGNVWETHQFEFERVEIFDRESGSTYWCSKKHFSLHYRSIDRGDGEQYMLPLRYWSVKVKASAEAGKQMALFGSEQGAK